jgi:hypothetical protein
MIDPRALLEYIVPDPGSFIERTLRQIQDQLASRGVPADVLDQPLEELIATVLGNSLVQMLPNNQPTIPGEWRSASGSSDQVGPSEDYATKNTVLAAALGACECWGERVQCPACEGAGVPGWLTPDEQLFEIYVRPAMTALKPLRRARSVRTAKTETHREESGDVQSSARNP